MLHNLVNLLFGVLGLALPRTWEGARNFLIGGGIIYLGLWLLGMLGVMDWLPADDTDDWLHLGLGAGVILLGLLSRPPPRGLSQRAPGWLWRRLESELTPGKQRSRVNERTQ